MATVMSALRFAWTTQGVTQAVGISSPDISSYALNVASADFNPPWGNVHQPGNLPTAPPVTFQAYPWHSQTDRFAAPIRAQHMKIHAETFEITRKK
jgi:hypothetical protein